MHSEVNPPDGQAAAGRLPVCRFLRSKGMYVTGALDPLVEHGHIGDGHCWCNKTQKSLGPDNGFVSRTACVEGRRCFVAPP